MNVTEEDAANMHCCGPFPSGKPKRAELQQIKESKLSGAEMISAVAQVSRVCIGARCMAWRVSPHRNDEPASHGYCGLAGRS